jgi:SNF2 family DNA or RNA helicase
MNLPDQQPLLQIDLKDSLTISFVRNEFVSDEMWSQLVSWWSDGAETGVAVTKFDVAISEFILKKDWLRSCWIALDRAIEFSSQAKSALKSSQSQFEEINALISSSKVNKSIDYFEARLKRVLTEHQQRNVEALISMRNGANFSVPGAGKTSTALVVWSLLKNRSLVGKLLVVCPRSAFEAWATEPEQTFEFKINTAELSGLSISPSTELLIVNYEQLENPDRLNRVESWVKTNNAMVIIDEAHRVKGGSNSVRWRACHRICMSASRVDLLTGTPMPQAYEDLRNLFSLSWQRVPSSFFSDEKLRTLKRGGIFVRTTKSELGLPPVEIEEVEVDAGLVQGQIYSALCRAYTGSLKLGLSDAQLFGRKGRAALTLLAVATNPGLLNGLTSEDSYLGLRWPLKEIEGSAELIKVVSSYASHEIPNKYNWIRHFVEKASIENRKVLIWSTFVGNLKALQKILAPFNPALVYGGVPYSDRQVEIQRFRHSKDCLVLLTNPQTLGEGVSLHQVCHEAIYVDRSFNAGLYLQSLDRIHRLGLNSDQITKIYTLSTRQSIDQRVGLVLERKIARLAKAMEDSGLVQASIPDFAEAVDFKELIELTDFDEDDLYEHLTSYD